MTVIRMVSNGYDVGNDVNMMLHRYGIGCKH
jgi:hypothetical protein